MRCVNPTLNACIALFLFYFFLCSFYKNSKRNSIRHKSNPSNNRHRGNSYQTYGQKNLNDGRQANILPIYNASWTKSPPHGFQQTRVGPLNHQGNRPVHYRDFQLSHHQTGGTRTRIQFDDINNSTKQRMMPRKPNGWKHHSMKKPISLPTTTYDPVRFVPVNDSNQDRQTNIVQNAQRQSDERSRQDEEQKRIDRERYDEIKRIEERRFEEKRQREEREKHDKELEDRNAEIEAQRRKAQEDDRLRDQDDLQRKELEEQQRRQLDEQYRRKIADGRRAESERRRVSQLQRYHDTQIEEQRGRAHGEQQKPGLHEIQTNEILDQVETSSTTTISPLRQSRLRVHLKNLSPEKLQMFMRKRAEKMKGKKRDTSIK